MPEGVAENALEKLPLGVKIGRMILKKQNSSIFEEMADLFKYMIETETETENASAIATQFSTVSSTVSSLSGQIDIHTSYIASLHPDSFHSGDRIQIIDENQEVVGSGKFHSIESSTSCRIVLHQIKNCNTTLPIPSSNLRVLGDCKNSLGKVTISWLSSRVCKSQEEHSQSVLGDVVSTTSQRSTLNEEAEVEILVLKKELELVKQERDAYVIKYANLEKEAATANAMLLETNKLVESYKKALPALREATDLLLPLQMGRDSQEKYEIVGSFGTGSTRTVQLSRDEWKKFIGMGEMETLIRFIGDKFDFKFHQNQRKDVGFAIINEFWSIFEKTNTNFGKKKVHKGGMVEDKYTYKKFAEAYSRVARKARSDEIEKKAAEDLESGMQQTLD
jgi:hypothetical protein